MEHRLLFSLLVFYQTFFYNATLSDCVIITQGGSSYSITLPQITDDIVGKLFVIIDGVGIANTVNITINAKIGGLSSYVIKERFGYVSLVAGRPSQGWSIISSSSNSSAGNVVGPTTAVNNNIPVFDGTSGTIIKDSGINQNNIFKLFMPFVYINNVATYDITDTDLLVVIYQKLGGTQINLPKVQGLISMYGRQIIIKTQGANDNIKIKVAQFPEDIDGADTLDLSGNWKWVWLVCTSINNGRWSIISKG